LLSGQKQHRLLKRRRRRKRIELAQATADLPDDRSGAGIQPRQNEKLDKLRRKAEDASRAYGAS
jgi:hypothetical protein